MEITSPISMYYDLQECLLLVTIQNLWNSILVPDWTPQVYPGWTQIGQFKYNLRDTFATKAKGDFVTSQEYCKFLADDSILLEPRDNYINGKVAAAINTISGTEDKWYWINAVRSSQTMWVIVHQSVITFSWLNHSTWLKHFCFDWTRNSILKFLFDSTWFPKLT